MVLGCSVCFGVFPSASIFLFFFFFFFQKLELVLVKKKKRLLSDFMVLSPVFVGVPVFVVYMYFSLSCIFS